jgi:hypothetical protein
MDHAGPQASIVLAVVPAVASYQRASTISSLPQKADHVFNSEASFFEDVEKR